LGDRNIGCARKPGQAGWVIGRGLRSVMQEKAGAFTAGSEEEGGKGKRTSANWRARATSL